MNYKEISDLLTQFSASNLTEFQLQQEAFSLYMNKNEVSQKVAGAPQIEQPASESTAAPVIASQPVATETQVPASQATESVSAQPTNTEEIVSPLVGVVYLQPAPDKPAFKQVGNRVKKGEVVCIIEAMKVMNEITATVDGIVTEVFVTNEEVVDYHQPLFAIGKEA